MCIFNRKCVLQCVDFDDEFETFPGGNALEPPAGESDRPRPLPRRFAPRSAPPASPLSNRPLTSNTGYALARNAPSINHFSMLFLQTARTLFIIINSFIYFSNVC